MQISPLQLKGYFLKELAFSLSDELQSMPKEPAQYDLLGIKVDADCSSQDDDPYEWRCELRVESEDEDSTKKLPYRFRVVFVGFFHVFEEFPADRVELMARTNAPALLYSAAREALIPLTSRGPYPAIVLPSVTFLEPPPSSPSSTTKVPTNGKKAAAKVPSKGRGRKASKPKGT